MSSVHASDWTSLILPIFTCEAIAIIAAAIYTGARNARVEGGWSRLRPGGLVWGTLLITSLILPFWLPQFIIGPPSLSDGAVWYFLAGIALALWLRSFWVLVRLGWKRVRWKGRVLRFNDGGAMVDIDMGRLDSARIGGYDVVLRFKGGERLAVDRKSVHLGSLLERLWVARPIFELPSRL